MPWFIYLIVVLIAAAIVVAVWWNRRMLAQKPLLAKEKITEKPLSSTREEGLDVFSVEYKGITYEFKGKGTYEELLEWFNNYAPKAPICDHCHRLIFPFNNIGIVDGKLVHHTFECCDSGIFYAGYIAEDGKLVPAIKDGKTFIENVLNTGETTIVNFPGGEQNLVHSKRISRRRVLTE